MYPPDNSERGPIMSVGVDLTSTFLAAIDHVSRFQSDYYSNLSVIVDLPVVWIAMAAHPPPPWGDFLVIFDFCTMV